MQISKAGIKNLKIIHILGGRKGRENLMVCNIQFILEQFVLDISSIGIEKEKKKGHILG